MKLSRWWILYVLSIGGLGVLAAVTTRGSGAEAIGGCTSNNSGSSSGGTGSSGGTSSSSGGAMSSGSGGPGTCTPPPGCMMATHQTVAAKLTMDSTWPTTTAIAGCDNSSCTADQRKVQLLLAIDFDIDSSGMYKGTLRTCQNQTPPITLSAFGAQASGVPMGSEVQVVIDQTVWDKQKSVNVTGSVANGAFTMDDVVALNGLDPNSTWKNASVTWAPISANANTDPAIPTSDCDNSDMNPAMCGITAAFKADMSPFIVPKVALSMTAPQTDKIYVVLRTEIALSGCMTSCTDGSGTATVPLLQNHVIGCHVPAGDASTDRACTPAEYNFIDQNSTAYVVVSGTFQSKVVSGTTCSDVRAAFPM